MNFGCQDDVVTAPAGESLANDFLRLALRVDVSGVDEIDPGIQRAVNDLDRDLMIRLTPGAKHHGAQAQWADLHTGTSEASIFHSHSLGTALSRQVPGSPREATTFQSCGQRPRQIRRSVRSRCGCVA
jgi:hypothetical protein